MSGLNGAAIFVIQTLGSLYLLIVLLRFILQLVRANFYNPLCQFIVKATQPLLKPLRRVIPSVFGLDMSSLVLAILVQMVIFAVVLTLSYMSFNILGLLLWAIIGVTALFLKVFFFAMIISVILSWVAPGSVSPGAELVNQITEPALAPFQIALVPLRYETEAVREATDKLYAELTAAGFEVLLDDRDKKTSPGIKFADMELIGIPHRIVVSDRGLAEGNLEYKSRTEAEPQALPVADVLAFLQARIAR